MRAIIGALNVGSEYALGGIPNKKDPKSGRGGWRDTDLEIIGPGAHAVIEEFLDDAERHLGKPVPARWRGLAQKPGRIQSAGDVRLRFIANNPQFDKTRYVDETYEVLTRATPKTEPIFIATPYFAPSKKLRAAMIDHMSRGGTVTVLTNSYTAKDVDILTDAARYVSRQLMKRGERFRLYERLARPELGESMLHHKVASFGTHGPIIVGSANLDAPNMKNNAEALALIQDAKLRAEFDEMVAADLAPDRAAPINRRALEDTDFVKRVRVFVRGKQAWYWL